MQSTVAQQLRELATLVRAGVAVLDAWTRLQEHHGDPVAARQHQRQGTPVHDQMLRQRLITPEQAQRLALAQAHGGLADCLAQLAAEAEERLLRWRRLRSRMGLSLGILGIGLLAGFMLTLADPEQGLGSFLIRALTALAPALVLIQGSRWLFQRDRLWWCWLYLKLPGLLQLPVLRQAFETTWYRLLLAQLSAGRDASAALTALVPLFPVPGFQTRVRRAARETAQGESLSQTLTRCGLVRSADIASVLNSGEQSGRLPELLGARLSDRERELAMSMGEIERWWPRLLYVTALFGVARMLGAV